MPNDHDPFAPHDVEQSVEAEPVEDVEETQEERVPSGSTKEVLSWVDGDKDKAQRALETEEAHEQPRKGLVRELKELLGKNDSNAD